LAISLVHLRGDLERQSGSPGEVDRRLGAFLWGDAPEKSEISLGSEIRHEQIFRDDMIDSADPSRLWQRYPLRVRNRDHRRICEALVEAHFKIRRSRRPCNVVTDRDLGEGP